MQTTDTRSARRPSALVRRIAALSIGASGLAGFVGSAPARDFALVDPEGAPVSLDTYREDGKWTLFMIRYHGCGPCDQGERELQDWFSAQDEDRVSVLALNLDDGDARDRTRERLEYERIDYPNVFTHDREAVSAGYRDITGETFVAVPSWLFFGPEGSFVAGETGPRFDWQTLDEMIASEFSGLLTPERSAESAAPKTKVAARSAEDERSDEIVDLVTAALVRGDGLRARAWLDDALEVDPEHHGLRVEKARFLMLDEREPADNPLGYRFSKETDALVQATLDAVLETDETHPRALYLLAELHATQGRLEEAEKAIRFPEALDANSRYRSYNRALLRIMRGEYAEAVAGIDSFLEKPFRGPDQTFMFQQAWARVKGVAMRNPEVDPLPLVREGLIARVDSGSMIDEIKRRGKSETPLLVISTSEDPTCSYCVDNGRDIEPFVRENEGKYDIIYTSVEPWRNIAYQEWAYVVPDARAVPKGVLFARSRYMASTGLPVSEAVIAGFEEFYPRMLAETPRAWNYPKREARAALAVAFRLWQKARSPVSAFASVVTDDDHAWGSSDDGDATQSQVDERAMEICAEKAVGKGIDAPCTLYVEEAK